MANLAIFSIAKPDPRRGRHLHWLARWGIRVLSGIVAARGVYLAKVLRGSADHR